MIRITPVIEIREDEIQFQFMRSSGPGGQHTNKAETAVQLRFDIKHSPTLPDVVRKRLLALSDRRITSDGVLVITASRFRSQDQNRQDALQRLATLVQKAAAKTKRRRPTAPSPASKKRRLEEKRRQAAKKGLRRNIPGHTDS